MSVLAGSLKFHRQAVVTSEELQPLFNHLDKTFGDCDGEKLMGNVGMLYRAFWTTPEAHYEHQPIKAEDILLTWDGRIDNRDELIERLDRTGDRSTITDAEIVLYLYGKLGTDAFPCLVGDWSLALWDGRLDTLFLARDYIGCRKLFYRLDSDRIVWSTSLEALVLTAGRTLPLDHDYLIQHLLQQPVPEGTPYRDIRSVGPAECCTIKGTGLFGRFRYWAIDPSAKIRYRDGAEYDDHFLQLLRTAISTRLRSDRTVVCELSGGLDSSSLVCVADDVLKSEGLNVDFMRTLSYFQRVDESADERRYFETIEQMRGLIGIHICLDQIIDRAKTHSYAGMGQLRFTALPGKVSQSLEREAQRAAALQAIGARVVLSGVGGDEVLGGVQYEAPELASYLLSGRMLSFGKALVAWSKRRRKTFYQLSAECLEFAILLRILPHLSVQSKAPQWLLYEPSGHQRSMADFAQWRDLSPTLLSAELARYTLSCQFSVTPARAIGYEEVRWPYLDRRLYVFLASIPREQVICPTQRRRLMRRALRGIVPEVILSRRTKGESARLMNISLREHASEILELLRDGWMSKPFFDVSLLAEQVTRVKDGIVDESLLIRRAVGLELWLRSVVNSGLARLQ